MRKSFPLWVSFLPNSPLFNCLEQLFRLQSITPTNHHASFPEALSGGYHSPSASSSSQHQKKTGPQNGTTTPGYKTVCLIFNELSLQPIGIPTLIISTHSNQDLQWLFNNQFFRYLGAISFAL